MSFSDDEWGNPWQGVAGADDEEAEFVDPRENGVKRAPIKVRKVKQSSPKDHVLSYKSMPDAFSQLPLNKSKKVPVSLKIPSVKEFQTKKVYKMRKKRNISELQDPEEIAEHNEISQFRKNTPKNYSESQQSNKKSDPLNNECEIFDWFDKKLCYSGPCLPCKEGKSPQQCTGKISLSETETIEVKDFVFLRKVNENEIEECINSEYSFREPKQGDPFTESLIKERIMVWSVQKNCFRNALVVNFKSGMHSVQFASDGKLKKFELKDPNQLSCEGEGSCPAQNFPTKWLIREKMARNRRNIQRNSFALKGPDGKISGNLGDNFDCPIALKDNWRWVAEKWHELNFKHENLNFDEENENCDGMFIPLGKVMHIDKEKGKAKVLQYWYPQDTKEGYNPSMHGLAEVFEACRVNANKINKFSKYTKKDGTLRDDLPIPTENLKKSFEKMLTEVSLCRLKGPARVHTCRNGRTNKCADKEPKIPYNSDFFISHRYCPLLDVYLPIRERAFKKSSDLLSKKSRILGKDPKYQKPRRHVTDFKFFYTCHKCRRIWSRNEGNLCSEWNCGKFFCSTCCLLDQNLQGFVGSCCRGTCTCSSCLEGASNYLNANPEKTSREIRAKGSTLRCHSCGHFGANSLVFKCSNCNVVLHLEHCRAFDRRFALERIKMEGLGLNENGIYHRSIGIGNEQAVGKWCLIQISKEWKISLVKSFRPSTEEHLFQIFDSIQLDGKSFESWERIKGGKISKIQWDFGNSNWENEKDGKLMEIVQIKNREGNQSLETFSEESLNKLCSKCVISRIQKVSSNQTQRALGSKEIKWHCPQSSNGRAAQWQFGPVDQRNGQNESALSSAVGKLINTTCQMRPTAFALPSHIFSLSKEIQTISNQENFSESAAKRTCARSRPLDPARLLHGRKKAGASRVVRVGKVELRKKDREMKTLAASIKKGRVQRLDSRSLRRQVQNFSDAGGSCLDILQARRKRLRFGRSRIHAWGVFAEEAISMGDMVIEYRGEIIRNTVADRREKMYHEMKIGSDYMFRIDEDTVVDATFKGSLARFINHSCDPNCYTQIIVVDGLKKIIIYAKRSIEIDEELTYDYKFPLEEKEENRLKCRCNTPKCIGFMN